MSGEGSPSASASGSPEDLLHEWALAHPPAAPPVQPGVSSAQALLQAAVKSQPAATPTTTESSFQKQLLDAAAQQTKADAAAAAAKSAADAKAKLDADALKGATDGRVAAILNSPEAKAAAAGKPTPVTDLGNTLAVGDDLGTGQRLTSAKNGYTLGINSDGDLVLTRADGSKVWESATSDSTGKAMWAKLDANGSLDLKADGHYQALTKWMTPGNLANAGSLVLENDGSLVVLAKDGKTVLSTISAADKTKHHYLVELYHPLGAPAALNGYLDTTQQWLQDVIDKMGIGKVADVPDLSTLMHTQGILDTSDASKMIDAYNNKVDRISSINNDLLGKDVDVKGLVSNIGEATATALGHIVNMIDPLNTILRAPSNAAGAPSVVKSDPVDITYTKQGDIDSAKLNSQTVSFLFGAISDCVGKVEEQMASVTGAAHATGSGVDKSSPDYAQGLEDGKAAANAAAVAAANAAAAGKGSGLGAGSGTDSGAGVGAAGAGSGLGAGNTDYSGLYSDLLPNGSATTTGTAGTADGTTGVSDGTTGGAGVGDTGATGDGTSADGTTGNTSSGGSSSSTSAAIDAAISRLENSASASGGGASTAGTGSGSSGSSSDSMQMMQMMQMIEAMKSSTTGGNGSGGSDNSGDSSDPRRNEYPQQGQPGQQTPAPAATTPAATAANPPAVTANSAGTPPATATKSMVDMKLPDGSTQQVSSVVAAAVNHEVNNPNGSDARGAYDGTPGAATATSPWSAVGTSLLPSGESVPDLQTGDVVQWADRTALIVVENGHPQMILDGHMVPFDPAAFLDPAKPQDPNIQKLLGTHGDPGTFQGFFHPSGAELDAGAQPGVTAGNPQNTTPPAVTAPTPT
ncbi:hypothetical protein [Nocardia sp. NPDC006630]|uniref:hypothetical protein n=1 Tax=Nocardia sp. NPDC006630 TaxID=3157181 RepID=UPI0033BF5474